ncbi:MAG TPA: ABC transporter ATP-binding protein [Acidobacteria bacterium]|jgi:putative ABC transport system ATP-binding protein|nr:ABC transporter ATP-binding protein [Acidobacteriota bacterium]|tara:strand:+ start:3772 stop:4458 length:687 start_codon:yes stop_codon:yes gene_type:complete
MAVVVLEARDIHKSYERGDEKIPVLNGLTVGLVAGSFTTLVGPSGCGKSTLLHICGAMDRPTSGEVRLEDESLTALDDDGLTRVRRERIGFVFQFFNLLPTLTVEQNIGLPLLLMGRSAQRVSDLSGQWAERVGISHRLNHFPSQLSGGEAQRVAIARAVIHQPVLILADEPTGNLDSETGRTILEVLMNVNRDSGTALLLATHDPVVAAAAGEVIKMRDGHIMRDSS